MWIRPRKVMAQWLGQDSSDQEISAAPVAPPAQCDVCGLEGHDRANCWAVIKDSADAERTWTGGSRFYAGEGDTFQLMREWWRRMQQE